MYYSSIAVDLNGDPMGPRWPSGSPPMASLRGGGSTKGWEVRLLHETHLQLRHLVLVSFHRGGVRAVREMPCGGLTPTHPGTSQGKTPGTPKNFDLQKKSRKYGNQDWGSTPPPHTPPIGLWGVP